MSARPDGGRAGVAPKCKRCGRTVPARLRESEFCTDRCEKLYTGFDHAQPVPSLETNPDAR